MLRTISAASPRIQRSTYSREVRRFELLGKEQEQVFLTRLVQHRDRWVSSFLVCEGALTALWDDLVRWRRGRLSASSLLAGSTNEAERRTDFEVPLRKLYLLLKRASPRHPTGCLDSRQESQHCTQQVLEAVLLAGLRPGPLSRYQDAAMRSANNDLCERIRKQRSEFTAARRPLIEHNLRLVLSIAGRYSSPLLAQADLIQDGNMGLIRATETYATHFGTRFSTYATLWIHQAIRRGIEMKSRVIRLPTNVIQDLRRTKNTTAGRSVVSDPSTGADHSHRILKLLANPAVARPVVCIDEDDRQDIDLLERQLAEDYEADSDIELAATIKDKRLLTPDEHFLSIELSALVAQGLDELPSRQREILRLRFGLADGDEHTLEEISHGFRVTRERIRQIESAALRRLRVSSIGKILRSLSDPAQ